MIFIRFLILIVCNFIGVGVFLVRVKVRRIKELEIFI